MKNAKIFTILVVALGLILCPPKVISAVPMGTAFTYQGRLIDANDTADALYDFQFKLFNSPADGNQVGSTIDINDLDVIDGYFTVELDFGNLFDGSERWLEIGVRPGDSSGSFTTLSPRQKITPVPFALGTLGMAGGSVLHLHLDEGSGLIAYDDSGNNNHCDLHPSGNTNWVDGKFWGAIETHGSDYVECPGRISFDNSLTFSAWVKPDLDNRGIISKCLDSSETGAAWHGAFLFMRNDDKFSLIIGDGSTSTGVADPNTFSTGQWYHVAGTYDGSRIALYVNGVKVDDRTWSDYADPSTRPLRIAFWSQYWTSGGFDGYIDEVIVYRRALSSEEIVELAGQGDTLSRFFGNLAVAGNVGIGTTSPHRRLHVAGNAGILRLEGADHAYIEWYPDGNEAGRKAYAGFEGAEVDYYTITNEIPGGNIILKTNEGNVGIGTVSPTYKLDVAGSFRADGLRVEPSSTSPNLIGGFPSNWLTAGVYGATITGGGESGATNRVTDVFGTVGGGGNNQAGDNAGLINDSRYATVGGGSGNTASGVSSTVAGGVGNTASGHQAAVGGGWSNTANYTFCTISGGAQNTASGDRATVGGGEYNTASGYYAAVPGGRSNTAQGNFSFAAGRRAKANHDGSFVWADSTDADFASTKSNQFLIRVSGGTHIEGDLTWKARTSYVSIPAPAFRPATADYDFENYGGQVWNLDGISDYYFASVQLPHGATVTKLTFRWYDTSAADGQVELLMIQYSAGSILMASVSSSGSAGLGNSFTSSIANATINNSQYGYILRLNLPDFNVRGIGVIIEYTFTEPH